MYHNYSRRDFLKISAAATGAGGLMCAPGCKKDVSFAIPATVMNTLGASSYASTMQEYSQSVVTSGANASMVHDSGTRIRAATEQHMKDQGSTSNINGFDWQFNLINDPTVNAWCMPGARIAFYEGIIPLCQDETGVAAVMGHEVSHAVYNHAGQRMAQQLILQLGITTLGAALSKIEGADPAVLNIALTVFGVGGQLGLLAYSRKHEYEADKMGLILMARAGYDPREAPKFWERMTAQFGGGGSDFFSTHPSNANRIKELNDALPEALSHYKPR